MITDLTKEELIGILHSWKDRAERDYAEVQRLRAALQAIADCDIPSGYEQAAAMMTIAEQALSASAAPAAVEPPAFFSDAEQAALNKLLDIRMYEAYAAGFRHGTPANELPRIEEEIRAMYHWWSQKWKDQQTKSDEVKARAALSAAAPAAADASPSADKRGDEPK